MLTNLYFFIYHLFLGKPFDFYSPYTLDETRQRLEFASERDKRKHSSVWQLIWWWFSQQLGNYIWIKVDAVKIQSYRFHVHRRIDNNTSLTAHGEVHEDESGVEVLGVVQINLLMRLIIIFWLVLWTVIFLISIGAGSSFLFIVAFLWLLWVGFLMLSFKRDQNKMYSEIYEILGKSEKKNSDSIIYQP